MAGPSTVLYVEDDEADRFFMQRAFAAAGIGPVLQTVPDGSAAIEYLAGMGAYADRTCNPFPQLVLLDVNLPRVSGFETLQWIRQQPCCAALPVIVFSSSALDEDRDRARELGASEYWEKPTSGLDYQKLVVKLREQWLSSTPSPRHDPQNFADPGR